MTSPTRAQDPPPPLELDENGLPEGHILIEGDIIVPETVADPEGTYATNLWPDGIVPYVFDANVTATQQAAMLNAMADWKAAAHVDFRPWADDDHYVHIRDSTGDPSPSNSSQIGRRGGGQVINITSWGRRFIIAHELGHALGYWHEQSRADRDDYVQIEWANICQNCCGGGPCDHNFDIRQPAGGEYGPYDFDSVMHYGACGFSACPSCWWGDPNCRTITVLPPNDIAWQGAIGQRTHLSFWDTRVMSFLYPEPDWVFVDPASDGFESGTFLFPYNTFSEGYATMPSGGAVWVLAPGTYSSGGVLSQPGRIEAALGSVILEN